MIQYTHFFEKYTHYFLGKETWKKLVDIDMSMDNLAKKNTI